MRAVRDPGLQAERTMLAWSRTALSLAGLALLAARGLIDRFGYGVALFAVAGLLTAAGTIMRAHRRYIRWNAEGHAYRPAAGNAALSLAVAALGAAVLLAIWGTP